jgi:hypothetical protein
VLWRELDSAPLLGQAGGSPPSTVTVQAWPPRSTLTTFKPAAGDQAVDAFIPPCCRIQLPRRYLRERLVGAPNPPPLAPRTNQTPVKWSRTAAPSFLRLYDLKFGPVPLLMIFLVLLLGAGIFVLRRTAFGRYLYAVGGNEQVARLSGIRIDRAKIGVYMLCSTLAALTGLLYLARLWGRRPRRRRRGGTAGDHRRDPWEDKPVWRPGRPRRHPWRRAAQGLTNNVLVLLNISSWYQELIQGLIIVGAVALYKQQQRR